MLRGRPRKEFALFPATRSKAKATPPLAKLLSCGCDGGCECPEAVRLWAEVNRQYELCRGRPTADYRWSDYDQALENYKQHKLTRPETDTRANGDKL